MKNRVKYLILGAGPAGLTFGTKLKEYGESSFIVLEKEDEAGGLCRSREVDGSPFDLGGGHFLDVRNSEVNAFLFQFMPQDEWLEYNRDSRIVIGNNIVHHPVEANIWEMQIDDQIEYLKSIAAAGCNTGTAMPENFVDWIYWKLGERIADDYMIPYNQKMFGKNLNDLGTYWLSKLPEVSFEDTLRSCLTKKAYAKQPGHACFYYPKKYGFGELSMRMADSIKNHMEYGAAVTEIDFNDRTVKTAVGDEYQADKIITTIPWMEFKEIKGMPDPIEKSILKLKYSSVQTEYFPNHLDTSAHWVYYPDLKLPYHRILVRHNFCPDSRGYWTETNGERITEESGSNNFKYMNQYAYPLNTIDKPEIMKELLTWAETRCVYGLGRWGEHRHYNSDVTVELALKKAAELAGI